MSSSQSDPLLRSRRFAPLFTTQFLGTLNGNLVKTTMLFVLVFAQAKDASNSAMVSIAAAVFVAPMIIFSAFAGALADMRDKAALTRMIKIVEIAFVAIAALAIAMQSTGAMLVSLFLLGTVSAFFGPIKYAIIPQHVRTDEIMSATGLIEAGTFVAILLGQIIGGLLSPTMASILAFLVAVVGFIASRMIQPAPPEHYNATILPRPIAATIDVITGSRRHRPIYIAILAISWFWAVGAILTSQLAIVVKDELNATPAVATLMLAMFSIGVAAGSMLASRLSKNAASMRPTAIAAIVMSCALAGFVWAVSIHHPSEASQNVSAFFASEGSVTMLVALAIVATAGGVFIVPLYAMLQMLGDPARRSRDVAANNILNAIFMVAGTGVAAGLAYAGLSSPQTLGIVAIANLLVGLRLATLNSDTHLRQIRPTA